MTYGYVYVASVSMGADMNQVLKHSRKPKPTRGPPLSCLRSCINQGIRKGMGKSMEEGKLAVDSGYGLCTASTPNWPNRQSAPDSGVQGSRRNAA